MSITQFKLKKILCENFTKEKLNKIGLTAFINRANEAENKLIKEANARIKRGCGEAMSIYYELGYFPSKEELEQKINDAISNKDEKSVCALVEIANLSYIELSEGIIKKIKSLPLTNNELKVTVLELEKINENLFDELSEEESYKHKNWIKIYSIKKRLNLLNKDEISRIIDIIIKENISKKDNDSLFKLAEIIKDAITIYGFKISKDMMGKLLPLLDTPELRLVFGLLFHNEEMINKSLSEISQAYQK